ncbi:MAG: hypothetical protein KDK91_14315 [Gammaproteobacteria bacterium]|nr:hypothetical protein [Gammaproteobacteria bacterium]
MPAQPMPQYLQEYLQSWPLLLILGLMAGALVAVLVLGGLRLTIARLPDSRHPALLVLLSMAIRLPLAALALLLVARGLGLVGLLGGLLGFLLARTLLVRRFGAKPGAMSASGPGTRTGD